MFSDTITVLGTDFVRINQDKYSSEYISRQTGLEFSLIIRHTSYVEKGTNRKISRHNVQFQAIVFESATTKRITRKAYAVVEHEDRDVVTDMTAFIGYLTGFLTVPALNAKFINGES